MNVDEVGIRVKRQFGDESSVQLTDDDIIRWINDAQRDIAQSQEILETVATSVSVAGQGSYPVPPDIINLRSVIYNNGKLDAISMQEFDTWINQYTSDPNNPEQAIPSICYLWGGEIRLYPVPNADGVQIKLYYSQFPPDVISIADTLTIPVKYHNRVVEYCLQQAYEMDENLEASVMKGQQFSGSMTQMAEDQSWTEHSVYPTITIRPEDC